MKIKVNKDILNYNIGLVSRAVVSKSTMNILECILMIADENGIKLISNNLDMGVETNYFDAEIIEEGKIALEGSFFSAVIKSTPSQEIYIETDDKFITTVKSGKSEIKISGRDPEVFPLLQEVSEDTRYSIEGKKFRDMIRKTRFAVASENIKPVLTGEYFEINDDNITMVGIDGYRIACVDSKLISGNGDSFSVVVPGVSLGEIGKLISDEEEIGLYFTENHMLAKFKDCTLITNLIEGEYMKYRHFFTGDFKTKAVIRKDEIQSCLDRVLLISKDVKKSPVKVEIGDNIMELSSVSESLGSMHETIDCEVDGEGLTIGFNPRYMQDIFHNIDADEVTLIFNASLSPCVIKGDEEYNYLLMPLRL